MLLLLLLLLLLGYVRYVLMHSFPVYMVQKSIVLEEIDRVIVVRKLMKGGSRVKSKEILNPDDRRPPLQPRQHSTRVKSKEESAICMSSIRSPAISKRV